MDPWLSDISPTHPGYVLVGWTLTVLHHLLHTHLRSPMISPVIWLKLLLLNDHMYIYIYHINIYIYIYIRMYSYIMKNIKIPNIISLSMC